MRPYPRNARIHSKTRVQQIARSIERFGPTHPVLVSDACEIIAGHRRVRVAALSEDGGGPDPGLVARVRSRATRPRTVPR
ncbi:MAG: ParB N-terminal domain-containing protein [Acetobacteraceae bacterium]|nr:ParB N-terminal domain-containing protein [Acetobacteraceae bacterium]